MPVSVWLVKLSLLNILLNQFVYNLLTLSFAVTTLLIFITYRLRQLWGSRLRVSFFNSRNLRFSNFISETVRSPVDQDHGVPLCHSDQDCHVSFETSDHGRRRSHLLPTLMSSVIVLSPFRSGRERKSERQMEMTGDNRLGLCGRNVSGPRTYRLGTYIPS